MRMCEFWAVGCARMCVNVCETRREKTEGEK